MYTVEQAEKLVKRNIDCYELTNEDDQNRLYFDVDLYVPIADYDEEEREDLDIDVRHHCQELLESLLGSDIVAATCSRPVPSKSAFKVSWRFYSESLFADKPTQKAYVVDVLNPALVKRLQDTNLPPIQFDANIYDIHRKIRMVGSVKDGETVPLQLEYANVRDSFITYIPTTATRFIYATVPRTVVSESTPFVAGVALADHEWDYCQKIVNLVPLKRIDDRSDCLKIIWGMWKHEQSDRMFTLICQVCAKSEKYALSELGRSGAEWVRYIINQCRMTVGFGTIVWFATQENSKAASAARRESQICFSDELFSLNLDGFAVERYEDKWVRPYSFATVDTLLIHSHLGTGKTRQTIGSKAMGVQGILAGRKRILYISARRSFTYFAHAELAKEGIDFVNYETSSGKLSRHDRLFIQVESLHRLNEDFTKYDLVVCDESESLLTQFHSLTTNKQNIIPNHSAFERVISTATKVLFADAFISNRTLNIVRHLRNLNHTLYIQNTYQPYARTAIHYLEEQTGFKKGTPAINQLVDCMKVSLKANKKIVGIFGAKTTGDAVYETLQKIPNKSIKFYSGDSPQERRDELKDTAKHWSSLDALMYTSTITIGVSFDKSYYDELFLVGCVGTALPRDTAQALLRCRTIKDNKLTYTCNLRGIKPATIGYEAIAAEIEEKNNRLTELFEGVKWATPPRWVLENTIYNENERRISATEYETVMERYLVLSGYTITKINDGAEAPGGMEYPWDSIPLLSDSDAAYLESAREVFGLNRWALKKYKFLKIVEANTAHRAWDDYIGCKNRFNTEPAFWNLWNEYSRTLNFVIDESSKKLWAAFVPNDTLRRIEIERLRTLFCMNHSQETKTLTHDEFTTLIPRIGDTGKLEKLFGWTSEAKDKTSSSYYCSLINAIWRSWGDPGRKLDGGAPCFGAINKRKKQVNGKREWIYDYTFSPNYLWSALKFSGAVVGNRENAEVLNHQQDVILGYSFLD